MMTIDEAKIKIDELACYARTKGWDEEYTEAVNIAIKALEQQPIVVMGDMIPPKRHKAEWIKTYTYYNEGWKCSNCGNFSSIRLRSCSNCLAEMEVQDANSN